MKTPFHSTYWYFGDVQRKLFFHLWPHLLVWKRRHTNVLTAPNQLVTTPAGVATRSVSTQKYLRLNFRSKVCCVHSPSAPHSDRYSLLRCKTYVVVTVRRRWDATSSFLCKQRNALSGKPRSDATPNRHQIFLEFQHFTSEI